ncbi:CBM96 family carbohydrate-binding protein [Jidongwangia harbinensis]|uniref:CBM96 family carbohydrate-binding protein n=1 Tax=Jidongwangia harbinensis TaxID=2878561 RepID=UPI001CD98E33|nr:DNRLRE domain-containing protein [Jidongwangia harbinensis]MCA2214004.1 DNRLRE domain-containing protein [Jidongwangia harbinensis]
MRSNLRKSASVLAAVLGGTGAVLAAPASAGAAAGPDLKVHASDDAYTSSVRRDAGFGAEDKLVVGRLGNDVKTSFLKFVVPAGTTVTGARLKLVTIGSPLGKVTVNRVPDTAWTEKKLTSANAPALGRPVAAVTAKDSDTELVFDLSAAVTGPGTYAFAVRSSAGATTRFRAAENASGRPELTVTTKAATPAPTKPVPTKPVPTTPAPTKPVPTTPAPTKPTPTTPAPTTPAPTTPAPTTPAPTTPPPTTPAPTTPAPTTPAPTTPAPTAECVTDALLVPSCGVLWGGAAGGFTSAPRDQALKDWENLTGRTATIFHQYHKGDEVFPTKAEIAMTRDPARPRVLMLNWKVAYGSTWAKVAKGEQDKRIDAFADRIKATYPEKFFLALNHEPENDVIAKAGSGWEAKDFAAMYRHTIERLRAKGVTNAINVMAYMGNEKWMSQSWWADIYPGDDVVDWIGLDSYVSAEQGYYHYGMFADLLDRKGKTGPGFYEWATTKHADKPLMIAEWGVYHRIGKVTDKSPGYGSVRPELAKRPGIKAIVHFDTPHDDEGDRDISVNSSKSSLTAFQKLAADPIFNVKLG